MDGSLLSMARPSVRRSLRRSSLALHHRFEEPPPHQVNACPLVRCSADGMRVVFAMYGHRDRR